MPDAADPKKPVRYRDPMGNLRIAPDWESVIERQIREAMEAGAFEGLPHQGEPLPNDDNPYAGEMALAWHVLKNAGVAPPWVEAAKEVGTLLAQRDALVAGAPEASTYARRRDRAALEQLVVTANAAIARLNAEAPTDRQQRRPLDLAAELARYDAASRG